MSITSRKVAAPALSLLMVAAGGAGTLVGTEAYAQEDASNLQAAASESAAVGANYSVRQTATVNGTFAFDQSTTTATADITNVFAKAAAMLCTSMPEYGVQHVCASLQVKAPSSSFEATVADLAAEEGTTSYTLACSCASNVAGGGAIANADVSGISLESVAQAAGVR